MVASSACGGARTGSPFEGDAAAVQVTVENDLTDRSDVLVRIVPGSGVPSTLGGVSPGRSGTFQFREPLTAGRYILTASTGDGRVLRSRPFTLFPSATVVWRLQHDELRVLSATEVPAESPNHVPPPHPAITP